MENNKENQLSTTKVKVLGQFLCPNLIKEDNIYPEISFSQCMKSFRNESTNDIIEPRKISAEGNLITILDQNENLWLISGIFKTHINVSLYVKRKFKSIFLNEKECIGRTKKGDVLINWGAKKLFSSQNLQEITMKFNDNFKAFILFDNNKTVKYHFSTMKKSQNSNKMYQINEQTNQIIGYPTLQKIQMKEKIVGMSAGKFHCMCWDIHGKLYTWGNKSIALGYKQLPDQKFINKPQQVKSLKGFITMGFAATHYSLALDSQGIIYEWGIKKQINEINEELIFQPTPLNIREKGKQKKFIMLKGKFDKFAALTTNSQLYLWGEGTVKILPKNINIPDNLINNRLYFPFKVPFLEDIKIIDYCIEDKFIGLITVPSSSNLLMEEQKVYWDKMLNKIKNKIIVSKKLKTQGSDSKFLKQIQRKSEIETMSQYTKRNRVSQNFKSQIGFQHWQRTLKKQYLELAKDESKFFKFIMDSNDENTKSLTRVNIKKRKVKNQKFNSCLKFKTQRRDHSKIQEQNNLTNINIKSARKYIDFTLHQYFKEKKHYQKFLNNKVLSHDFNLISKRQEKVKKPYTVKLQQVLQRKKSFDESFMEEAYKKVQQNSLEFRTQRHEEIAKVKLFEKNKNVLKITFQNFLIKNYLIKMFCSPVDEARRLKIQQFARSLRLKRIQKNLRQIFIKYRVKKSLKMLSQVKFHSYVLLCLVFKRFMQRKRQQKAKKCKKLVIDALYKSVIKDKIRFGLSKTHLNVRKLQKFREWLVLTKNERVKCLKILWKNHLLSVIKIKVQCFDTLSLIRSTQNYTFETLYNQRLSNDGTLKLQNFLNKSPIFQLRGEYFQSLIFLFGKDRKQEKILKKYKKKPKIKFNETQHIVSCNPISMVNNDILPYSLHYNSIIRPNAMQINIPENMKMSEKWINEEKRIMQKFLQKIIMDYERKLRRERRRYDIKLAYFIKQKYDILSQKRWKCIIEYNQLKPSIVKSKKQKELYRLFDLIGMTKTLNEDCLPQKYLMLEEAQKRRDAPNPPNPYITFNLTDFKILFKQYYEALLLRAKQLRKNYI